MFVSNQMHVAPEILWGDPDPQLHASRRANHSSASRSATPPPLERPRAHARGNCKMIKVIDKSHWQLSVRRGRQLCGHPTKSYFFRSPNDDFFPSPPACCRDTGCYRFSPPLPLACPCPALPHHSFTPPPIRWWRLATASWSIKHEGGPCRPPPSLRCEQYLPALTVCVLFILYEEKKGGGPVSSICSCDVLYDIMDSPNGERA